MPMLMQLQGPSNLGCVGCTRPTSQPGTNGVSLAGSLGSRTLAPTRPCINCTPTTTVLTGLGGASSSFLSSPLMLVVIGLGLGGFLAYRTMRRKSSLSGHRKRRRR